MGKQINMKAFLCLSTVLAAASAAGIPVHGVHAAVHAPVLPTHVSAAVAPVNYGANRPVNGYGHGQVSHQSVSKPYQGEHRGRLSDPMLLLLLMPPTDFTELMLLSPMEFMLSMPQFTMLSTLLQLLPMLSMLLQHIMPQLQLTMLPQ